MVSMSRGLPLALVLALAAPLSAQQAGEPARLRPARERVVYNPQSVPASQVNFLKASDVVVGVAQHGAAKAYWLPMVIWTHFIEDRVGDLPILVTW